MLNSVSLRQTTDSWKRVPSPLQLFSKWQGKATQNCNKDVNIRKSFPTARTALPWSGLRYSARDFHQEESQTFKQMGNTTGSGHLACSSQPRHWTHQQCPPHPAKPEVAAARDKLLCLRGAGGLLRLKTLRHLSTVSLGFTRSNGSSSFNKEHLQVNMSARTFASPHVTVCLKLTSRLELKSVSQQRFLTLRRWLFFSLHIFIALLSQGIFLFYFF